MAKVYMKTLGERIVYIDNAEDIPEGLKLIQLDLGICSNDVKGGWFQKPRGLQVTGALEVVPTMIKLLEDAIKMEDFDDDGAWVRKAIDFVTQLKRFGT